MRLTALDRAVQDAMREAERAATKNWVLYSSKTVFYCGLQQRWRIAAEFVSLKCYRHFRLSILLRWTPSVGQRSGGDLRR